MVAYQKIIKERGLIQSMSRKGNCLNNTVMENWFGILKTKLFYGKRFEDLQAFKQELKAYIDCYNHQWIKQKIKGAESSAIPNSILSGTLIKLVNFSGSVQTAQT